MPSITDNLLARYEKFSQESDVVNKALSATSAISAAYPCCADRQHALLVNDLNLFLLQVLAFDGFITACLHALGLPKNDPIGIRVKSLTTEGLKQDKRFDRDVKKVEEIFKVRDAWMHGLGDPGITKTPEWPRHFNSQFGIVSNDGRLWIRLTRRTRSGCTVWSFVTCTLRRTARRVWPDVELLAGRCLERLVTLVPNRILPAG
jgi:hypothetical protein